MYDSRVLRHSSLFLRVEQNEILKPPEEIIGNLRVPSLLLGDGQYPLCKWFLKPYNFTPVLNNIEKKFNKKLSSSRVIVKRLFCICKVHWSCLLKKLDNKVENISDVITCFPSFNFYQIEGKTNLDDDGILEDLIQKEIEFRRRRALSNIALQDENRLSTALKNYVEEIFQL